MQKLLIIMGLLLSFGNAMAQSVLLKGEVLDANNQPLLGASVQWLETAKGTVTDESGTFELEMPTAGHGRLIASYVGFQADTLAIHNTDFISFKLIGNQTLTEIEVTAAPEGTFISSDPIKTKAITAVELKKSACCDLASSFATEGSVQSVTTNVLTNARELRILGLSGVYNQILFDGAPLIQGLPYTYGISSIPGTMLNTIYVAKGANSVLQGFEGISGQINVIPLEAEKTDKLLVNGYLNSFGEKQWNVNYARSGKNWSNLTSVHTAQPGARMDRDEDTFLDMPLLTRYMIYNKFRFRQATDGGFSGHLGLRFWTEKRSGGQRDFDIDKHLGSNKLYGQTVDLQHPEIYTKVGYRFDNDRKLTLIASAFQQNRDDWFGFINYNAKQTNAYANLQYEYRWNMVHELKAGASYRYLNLDENIRFAQADPLQRTFGGDYQKQESILGIFAENILYFSNVTLITGIRLDHHNQFGWFATPRALLKYDFSDRTNLRLSAGTGYRTANVFPENINLLASSRNIIFAEALRPERAMNLGINLVHQIYWDNASVTFGADFYHTQFSNQIFPDYNSDPTQAILGNFEGASVSNSLQAEMKWKFFERLEVKTSYNFLDVYRMVDDRKVLLPFNARHNILATFSYEPKFKSWHFDSNIHWFGKQQLPDTQRNPELYQQPDASASYLLVNAQFTKVWKTVELYAGCENIFDFRQLRPILSWQDPFGQYFDTAFNWGPTRGREAYVGFRFKIL